MSIKWAQLKGEGGKLQEFAQVFINELIAHNMKCTEIPGKENEIRLKIKTNPLLKGKFHAMQQDGNLYYDAFVKHNYATYFGVMGLLALVGMFTAVLYFGLSDLDVFGVLIAALILPGFWVFIGGLTMIGEGEKKGPAVTLALKSAEAEIRSL